MFKSNDTQQQTYKAGDIIMRQGDHGTHAFIIESGSVEILLEAADGSVQNLGTRGAGAMIGEMALIDDAPRTATIKALDDCKLQEITHEDFALRLERSDPILRMTTQVILTRYRDMLTRAEISNNKDLLKPAEDVERQLAAGSNAFDTVKIANDFKQSLQDDDISLNYQPITDLVSEKTVGFEALMRWNHPTEGFISPGKFIPIIEDNGFIQKASQWALNKALDTIKEMIDTTGNTDLFMSVNFSSLDFAADDFYDNIIEAIESRSLLPHNLHIEITESLLMGHPDKAKDTLTQCHDYGIGISIDDFGTGYSSLSYLHYFPIDLLKIDLSFVQQMLEDASMMEVVKTIVSLSKNMNMDIIAEGIETAEQAEVLRALGCEMGQGYFYSKPLHYTDAKASLL